MRKLSLFVLRTKFFFFFLCSSTRSILLWSWFNCDSTSRQKWFHRKRTRFTANYVSAQMILSILSNGWRWHDFTSCFFFLLLLERRVRSRKLLSSSKPTSNNNAKKEMMKLTYIHLLLELSVFAWLETILESVHNPSSIIFFFFAHPLSLSECTMDEAVVVWCEGNEKCGSAHDFWWWW